MRIGEALDRTDLRHPPFLVPYLLVDRGRRRELAATVTALRDGGATAIELGFPFSDPIADGPVLEAASGRALRAGTDWSDLLGSLRAASPILPTAVMTYANPVWRHGFAPALAGLRDAGASGLIVPDLSYEESAPWRAATRRAGLDLILLAAPGASPDRVERIARHSRGFLYLVSRYGTTGGGATQAAQELAPLIAAAHRAAPGLAVLVGFGVRNRKSRDAALESGADGVIVGTALEERLARGMSPRSVRQWTARLSGRANVPAPDGVGYGREHDRSDTPKAGPH
ncbi:MAG TPA: tryptophan synthase subunit alpha [Thermoplasmata archaeon]|nr:tryptophan synthase subunit alpha [Thermoplasmata archaeon]